MLIEEVLKNSIAEELGLKKGDKIIAINEKKPKDLIEYSFLCKTEFLTIETENEIFEIEKDFDEDLGIVFSSAVFDRVKPCTNRCIFCFVDQQPKGLRPSLYVKDDDYRLSYLQGTYITLTNLTKSDRKRIEEQHLAPLFISVHTTNGTLRAKMLQNPKAENILNDLQWLESSEIPFHAQIVLCPGFNDGKELMRTLNDLKNLKNVVLSIAIVPIGITKFRKEKLKQVDKKIAQETINIIEEFNKGLKKPLAAASDEFFLLAEQEIPSKSYYGSFSQIEDGVGALRLLIDDFEKRKKSLPKSLKKPLKLHLITSKCALYAFSRFKKDLESIKNLELELLDVKSNFWGKDINVAGLTTGKDILEQISPIKDEIETLVIPSVMLRAMSDEFLDGIKIKDIEKQIGCKVLVIKDAYSSKELIELIKKTK